MTDKINQFCQGDLMFERIDIPANRLCADRMEKRGGHYVIERGEKTGHAHTIDESSVEIKTMRREGIGSYWPDHRIYSELFGKTVIVVPEEAQVIHEEHEPLTLPSGTYVVRRQREFDYTTPEREPTTPRAWMD